MSTFIKSAYPLPRKGNALFYRSTNYTTTINVGDAIPIFESIKYSDSDNITRISATQITLKANKKYRLSSSMVLIFSGTTAGNGEFQFYIPSTSSYVGTLGHTACLQFSYDTSGGYTSANLIIAPTVDTTLELRFNRLIGTITALSNLGSYVDVEELETYIPASTGTQNINGDIATTGNASIGGNGNISGNLTVSGVIEGSVANANKLSGYSAGNASGNIPLSNLTENLGLVSQRSRLLFNRMSSNTNSILDMALSDFTTYGQGLYHYTIKATDPACPWTTDGLTVLMGYPNYAKLIAFKLNTKAIAIRLLNGGTWETAWTYLTDDNGNAMNANMVAGRTVGNASGNVPLANGTVCDNLLAKWSQAAYLGAYTDTTPLNHIINNAPNGRSILYVQYNSGGSTSQYPSSNSITTNWFYHIEKYGDYVCIHVESANDTSSVAAWKRKYNAPSWSGWTQLTDASGNAMFPSVATTASAANAYIGANGTTILKSTSSKRYKTDIRDLDDSSTLDQLRPVLYKSNPETVPSDDPTLDHYGFIAEDIDEFDNKLVQYIINDEGEKVPDGVQYDRITVLLVKRVQELKYELSNARASADSLSEKVKTLEDRLTKAGIQ